ncbi:MAG: hypothetical protein JSU87_06290 [Gemmatimonadota bacterium]|nr:MAG: hypothetical protein JSU87_06290 [Gemmatimonadota bacterium]
MDCAEFLSDYSDFLDCRFEEHSLSSYCQHLLACRDCAEYDRVMRRGLYLVRQLDPPADVGDCLDSLSQQLTYRSAGTRLSGVAAVAGGAFLALAVVFILDAGRATVELPPVVVEAPAWRTELPSLWGPPPRLAPATSLLEIPALGTEPFLTRPEEPFSLFRGPVRSQQLPERVAEAAQ